MDPYSSRYEIPNNSPHNPFPHSLLRTRQLRFGDPKNATWRFMGSFKWSYKSTNMGYNSSYPTYIPPYNFPSADPEPSALYLET